MLLASIGLSYGLSLAALPADTVKKTDGLVVSVQPRWEAGVLTSGEAFASRLSAWQWHSASLRYRGTSGSHALDLFTVRRHGMWNSGFAFEETHVYGASTYFAFRGQLAPGATIVARTDLSVAWYQTIRGRWELIPTARFMSFRDADVPILGLGLGRYSGLWYLSGRVNAARQAAEHGVTWAANARRYAAHDASHFLEATLSHGHEIAVLGPSDAALRQATSAAFRGQRMMSRSFGASLTLTYDANASLPDRRGALLSAFARW
jgi:YaiO family outer membrane protein